MAYLTSYNYGKLCQELKLDDELQITLEVFLEHIYNDKDFFYILNKLQLEYLFKYRMLLADTETFILKYYKHVPEEEDNKVWVFSKGGKIKYHLSLDCKTLGNDFIDFRIPDDIRNKGGDEAIDEYRNWFTNQRYAQLFKDQKITKDEIINAYNSKYPKKYGIEPIKGGSNLLTIELKNSGSNYTGQKKDVNYLILELNQLLLNYREYFPGAGDRIIAKHSYLKDKTDDEIIGRMKIVFSEKYAKNLENQGELEKLKNRFKTAHDLTFKIIQKLVDYFKWTYNLQWKSFDPTTLENFGLVCCKSCSSTLQDLAFTET